MIQRVEHSDEVEIAEIQIDPSHQSRGIGTGVLLDVISTARARGHDVRLSVGLTNQKAINLDERLGFTSVERSETHCYMRYRAAG